MNEDIEKKMMDMRGLSDKELIERLAQGLRNMTPKEVAKLRGDLLRNSNEAVAWNKAGEERPEGGGNGSARSL